MSTHLIQKTFKMELEFTVTVDELGQEHLDPNSDQYFHLPFLKLLQQALVEHEPALLRQMLSSAMNKLQEYADYLAAQSSTAPLQSVVKMLEPEDREFFETADPDFSFLTRPIRLSAISTQLTSSQIQEKVGCEVCPDGLKEVWADLRQGSEYGRLLEKLAVPSAQLPQNNGNEAGHYLMARYLTRQTDGVHLEARCSCGAVLEGTGWDESAALLDAWSHYKKHTEFTRLGRRIKTGIKKLLSKN